MRRFVKDNGLTLFFLGLFLGAVVAQGLVGWKDFNNDELRHGGEAISLGRFLVSSEFGVAVLENWQSEYLQFTLYVVATVWLIQRGSPESKEPGNAGRESDERQKVGGHASSRSPRWARAGGLRTALYSNSLLIEWARSGCWPGSASRSPGAPPTTPRCSSTARIRSPTSAISAPPTSGSARFRTGSRSSWRSARWRSCRFTCGSVARRRASATHEATGTTG